MLRHHLLIIYRNLKRHKSSFFINLIGLSTGLACALLIYLWVNDELSVDQHFENNERLYQVMENVQEADRMITRTSTSGSMAKTLAGEMPEVEYAAMVTGRDEGVTVSVDEKNVKANGKYVSNDFFNVFSFPIILGTRDSIWKDHNSVMISQELAKKLFGERTDIIGIAIDLDHEKTRIISGIFDVADNSSMKMDFVESFEGLERQYENIMSWGSTPANAFVLLKPDTDVNASNSKIKDYVAIKTNQSLKHRTPFLKRFSDQYLYGKYENGIQSGGRIDYVYMFSIIAIFILVIACINFMNLSTASASQRLKDIGVKKVVGSSRESLILQYFGESLLMTMVSVLVALLMVFILLPNFNDITGKHLALNFDLKMVISILAITILTGLLSGSYPSIYLTSFNPVLILKGKLRNTFGELWTRKGLVVFQLAISIILIVSVIVVYNQIDYTQNKNLGYDNDNLIIFDREGKTKDENQLDLFINELRQIPGVVNASAIGHDLTGHNWGVFGFDWAGKDPTDNTEFEHMVVYYDMIEMLDIEIIEGRTYSRDYNKEPYKTILNKAAIEHMGLENPIGKTFRFWGQERQIIGIAENFNFESLHQPVRPLMFSLWKDDLDYFMVRIQAGREKETLAELEKFYSYYNPGFAFDYKFLDQKYDAMYAAEQRVSLLSKYFAALAILISCLGLFGLAAFTAEKRSKEIGIRKVLGSSELGVFRLLTGEFTGMVLIAILIALPLSFLVTDKWLETFAYHIDLAWWYFAGAGLITILITWLTVGMQTVKAAMVNPAKILRSE